jgi:hypothetical protein
VRPSLVNTGRQKGAQLLSQRVDEELGHVLGAGTQLEDGNALAQRINGDPEPQDLGVAAQPRAQFVQWQMRQREVTKGALMQGLGMRPCPQEPMCDGRMSKAKDPFSRRQIQSFRQRT